MSAVQPAPFASRRALLLGVVLLIATLAGGWRAAGALTTAGQDPRALHTGAATFTVTHAELAAGLSDADVGGMSHNISGLVPDTQLLVRVAMTVSGGGSATRYNPQLLRLHIGGSDVGIPPVGGSLTGGTLAAHGRIEGSVSFVVKRTDAHMSLRIADQRGEVPLVIGGGAPATGVGHDHASQTSTPPQSGPAPPVSPK